ncbi:unnamed protein product, partial [Prorocentrum cordatum]
AATVEDRWRATKTRMKAAARRVRDEMLRANFPFEVKDGNAETTHVGFKSAARALWRQDAPLAARLLASCPALSAHPMVDQGSFRVVDSRAFGETFDAVAAKVRALRGQAAAAAARRSNDRDGPAWRRVERRSARHAQLWIPWRRRIVLAGPRLDSAPCASSNAADVPPKVVGDSAGMTGVVAEYWGKIFERAPTVEQKLRLNKFLDRRAPQLPVVELPQPSLRALERDAARAPPSDPEPDQLPYAAWRSSSDALSHLHALTEQLFNEGMGPRDPNWSIFPCALKGAEDEDTPDSCTRTASSVRTLSLKNADAKLIASCADRALQSIASVATDGAQKGFTAGRRFVDHIPLLDAECRREALLPGAAQRRPMLLSYDFRQAFPSLFRDVTDIALPRCGVLRGFCSAVSALRCNCLAFSSFRASGPSAAMEPLFALRCGTMQGYDLGLLIRNAKIPTSIADSFNDIEFAFNLQLAIHKCVLVPLWAEVSPSLIKDTEEFLAELVPSWRGFRVDSSAKYLGTGIGPGISEQGIWKDAAAKWWSRAAELSRAGMATSLAARARNVNVLPCLSYLAQLFFLIPEIWRVEFTMLHRLLRFPPSSMRKADILAMARGWAPVLRSLHETAAGDLPLVRVLRGAWSPPWWASKRAIAQYYGLVMGMFRTLPRPRPELDELPAPAPPALVEAARRAMADEELAAAAAVPTRKVKRQELRGRWLELRAALRAVRPSWLWSWLRTAADGWITSGRMHVVAPRPCIFGCDAKGDLARYMNCEKLRSAVAAPAEPSELKDGIVFLGLGHPREHRARARKTCLHAVALATQLFQIVKERIDS